MAESVLRLTALQKSFGGTAALRGAELEVQAGEIHGLVGENGAGKSTLINIATGVLPADSGVVLINGRSVSIRSPQDAATHGIAVVHQEADLFPQLSIAENMLLGQGLIRGSGGMIQWPETYNEAALMVARMGETYDVHEPAGNLSVARRMMAEIAAAIAKEPRVLFLDEPTSALTQKETDNLFGWMRRLRDSGVSIIYVSHRLEEVLAVCDRVTIMRDGETVETHETKDLSIDAMVTAMIGREPSDMYGKRDVRKGDVRLQVNKVTDSNGAFEDISFDVRAGEVVGIYGFVGAGRSELAQSLFGLRSLSSGAVFVDEQRLHIDSPRKAVHHGIAYLPEDRLVQGVFRGHSVRSNASVTVLPRLTNAGIISSSAERALASEVMRTMNVRAKSQAQAMGTLSGGNQQKVIFGRWRSTDPRVLILDEPTRGVDVGAKADIHELINDMAEKGTAVVLISSDLPEIMAMSDRVLTLSEGRLTGEFDPNADGEKKVVAAAVPRSSQEEAGSEQAGAGAAKSAENPLVTFFKMREFGLLAFTAILCAGMGAARPTEFLNVQNFLDILANAALPAIVAQGAMMIICAGGIDISVGSMIGLVGAVAGMAAVSGVPAPLCLATAIGMGAALSILNAATSLIARIHPIIVTLAGISIFRGIMRIVTDGREVVNLPDAYRSIADGTLLGVPKICFYVLAVTAITHFVLRYQLIGRYVLAIGNSESASRLIGLSKTKVTLFVFAYSGALVGLTSVLLAAYYGKVQANTGDGMELKAIAAAVIGGTNILGGRGSAIGTLLGAFLMALLYNMLVLMEISSYWQNVFVGGLILAAVVVDVAIQRYRRTA